MSLITGHKVKVGEDFVGGAEVGVHVVEAGGGGVVAGFGVEEEGVEDGRQLVVVFVREAAAEADDVVGFLELAVVGAEYYGFAESDSLEGVVDALPEAAADIGDIGVAVEGREKTKIVYDED